MRSSSATFVASEAARQGKNVDVHRGGYSKDTHVLLHTVRSMRVYAATSAFPVILHSRSKTMKLGKKTNDSLVKQYRFQTYCHSLGIGQPTSAVPMVGATLQESIHTARLQHMQEGQGA